MQQNMVNALVCVCVCVCVCERERERGGGRGVSSTNTNVQVIQNFNRKLCIPTLCVISKAGIENQKVIQLLKRLMSTMYE